MIKEYQSIHCWGFSSQCLLASRSKDREEHVTCLGDAPGGGGAARLAQGKGEVLNVKINQQLILVKKDIAYISAMYKDKVKLHK